MTYDNTARRSTTGTTDQSDQQQPDDTATEQSEMAHDDLLAQFPVQKLITLHTKISSPRWVVPVLPEQELECLLNAAIKLSQLGIDQDSEPCMRFYKESLTQSFLKILTDDAVNSWKNNIHHCILMSCGKLLHLCALHMKHDNSHLLDLLAIVFDPENKFHSHNAQRQPELFNNGSTSTTSNSSAATVSANPATSWGVLNEGQVFARSPPDPRNPRGWLVDLINRFGQYGGFDNLLDRFNAGITLMHKRGADPSESVENVGVEVDAAQKLTLPIIYLLIRPFGQCYELLTEQTIEKYFMNIWAIILELLENLSDDELKREAKLEGKNDTINGIVKAARCLISRIPNQENLIKDFEMCRLKIILRVLQTSSFNGKMNALNEINKVLGYVTYYPHRAQTSPDDDVDYLTAEKMAKWIKETNVLSIVLRDSLHQPQYVEKLEKILRFLIKEKALSLDDLDAVWRAQAGKHEAIVKNVHDLLAKLAWDFDAEQLDHLFECFQASMKTANKKQRERLLELNRRLAEDDKNGVMAHKVLKLFWSLAHSADVPPEVLDQALASHVKILDYSCSQERDAQKTAWLDKCVEELKSNDNWVLPALRLIREICCLYEATPNHGPRTHPTLNRQQVIERLQNEHTLVILVTISLTAYLYEVRKLVEQQPDIKPTEIMLDKRYPHPQQIQERLDFLKFLLKDGQLWLCADQAKQIWQCLAVNAAFTSDREECFRWFGKLMGDEPDLDPHINKDFFENNILQLDPKLLTESGIKCFERFFKAVNSNAEKLKAKNRGYVLDDDNLIGKDYLWRVITTSGDDISFKAIELLKEVSTALGPRLQANIAEFHANFIDECCEKLRTHYEMILSLNVVIDESEAEGKECKDIKASRLVEAEKMCRIIRVLQEYIKECDRGYTGERLALPLARASRGKHITIYLRFQNHSNRPIEDIEVVTHSNETIVSFKRNLQKRLKGAAINNIRIDLYSSNGELIEIADERHPLSQYNIRDKTFTVKLTPIGPGASGGGSSGTTGGVGLASSTAAASSPDSSSDSSTGSPPRPCPEVQRSGCEQTLPGIIISKKPVYKEFFVKLYQLGSDLQHGHLRECSRALLHLLPLDRQTVRQLQIMCRLPAVDAKVTPPINVSVAVPTQPQSLDSPLAATCTADYLFLNSEPASVLYNLEVLHAILLPALDPLSDNTLQLQSAWLHSGGAHFILDLLIKTNFLNNADMHTKRAAYQCVLRLVKLFLYIVGCVLSRVGDEPTSSSGITDIASGSSKSQVDILKQALTSFPGNSEHTLRASAVKLAQNLAEEMLSAGLEGDRCRKLFESVLQWQLPNFTTIKAIVELAWVSSIGNIQLLGRPNIDLSQETSLPEAQDFAVCKEALEVLSIALVLNHTANDTLGRDPQWNKFISSIVLANPSRHIRQNASEQLFLTCTYCASDRRPFTLMIVQLIETLQSTVNKYAASCSEFFQLLCRILNYGCMSNWPLPANDGLLSKEIQWLRKIRETVKLTGETQVHDDLLEGHLCLAKELMFYLNPELKSQLSVLITELVDDFLFPASRQYVQLRRTGQISDCNGPPPVCRNPHTIAAACDLLVALCQNSVFNMKLLVTTLTDMFCSAETEALREWEYLPPVGPRPSQGFCGLKNAGATCYMNSVLQQLFMVPHIRVGILSAAGAATDANEDFSGEVDSASVNTFDMEEGNRNNNYHVGILKHVQAIFGHLGHSSLQFYVPRGLWSHFKLQGEPVNLREQQDAVEFFMSLFESLDEGLKALGHPQLMGATLGGCFSDQKICQGCPHRYSKDEPFSVFSVDIRNHSSLTDSLEQYVKGELLEGADAYHCDKCDKKVVTIKRLCVRKLPPVLAIQLKRFEYDYERVCAIKFNDYFEFPRGLDMEPYTVSGLAKLEGEVIDIDEIGEDQPPTTKYQLTGIVVHSGQASGGHYFSYILHKNQNGSEQWYKFDDGEVTECKMHEDEELKAQCFGGEYMGEVYDNNLKRMQYRRQKRWWNAYMLFYTRCDQQPVAFKQSVEQLALAESKNCVLPMPAPIEKSVRSQNIRFLHARSLFSTEFFTFIRKLVSCNVPPRADKLTPQAEELSLMGIQLATQFLFHSGFRTKKQLRGAAIDWYEELKLPVSLWYDTLCQHIRHSAVVRRWFANNALLNPQNRLGEYILIAPSPEVRTVFVKLVVFFCHFAIGDDPLPGFEGSNLCEQILIAVLALLKCEVSEHGKHLPHYFSLFSMYAGLGLQEKHQLLKLNVPAIFMKVALDEGPGPPIKFQYPDLSKLHQVVSHLVRSSDISSKCQSSMSAMEVLPNDFVEPNIPVESLLPLSSEAMEYLFNKTSYIKKLVEDANIGEEGIKLLQYCSWENPHFSRALLKELLWSCGFAYWHDMRHYTDLLLNILLIKDSWHHHRIHNAIMGVSEEREGLLDTIQRNKSNYQKRAYQCIKCLVQLFTTSRDALDMLYSTPLLARQWTLAVEWLQDELDRQRGVTQYSSYSSWSPPAPSNENTNNYTIERSASAKNILQMAFALCPEEDQEEASDELEIIDDPPPLIGGSDPEVPAIDSTVGKLDGTKNSNMTLQYILQNFNENTTTSTTVPTTKAPIISMPTIIRPSRNIVGAGGGDNNAAIGTLTGGINQMKISPTQSSPSTNPSDSNSSTDTTSTHLQTSSSSPTNSTALPDTTIMLTTQSNTTTVNDSTTNSGVSNITISTTSSSEQT